ncbi:hypothetical protein METBISCDRAFT_11285 [Metschnikowia bicuspidata]|uniref:Uncharacterized protein n=1 Tax=Metschnikowia bicuspidata TaxID=27322 RepID=A0A4P9ZJ44_9ASCO|nr:hypothetical protein METBISCDRAFT_11285 [Metschnikowia bicuspidata]
MNFDLRAPLISTNCHNSNHRSNHRNNLKHLPSSDLDQLEWELKRADRPSSSNVYRSRFETESAIVSSFKQREAGPSPQKGVSLTAHLEAKTQNKDSVGYTYLCRIQAIKQWLEEVVQVQIEQSAWELNSYLRNGIYLARLANMFMPSKRSVYSNDSKLDFRHTENINTFFRLLRYVELPLLFYFELTDLFDAKDIPKVWYCLHALSYRINLMFSEYPLIQNMVGSASFEDADIAAANRFLLGGQLPGFSDIDIDSFSSPVKSSFVNKALNLGSPTKPKPFTKRLDFESSAKPLPVLPELKKQQNVAHNTIRRILLNSAHRTALSSVSNGNTSESASTLGLNSLLSPHTQDIVRIQALARGSMLRYKIFVDKIILRSHAPELQILLSIIRGYMVRQKTYHGRRKDVMLFEQDITSFQAIFRASLLRNSLVEVVDNSHMDYFQSIIRGRLVRWQNISIQSKLCEHENSVILFQSVVRRKKIAPLVATIVENHHLLAPAVLAIQKAARGSLLRKKISKREILCSDNPFIIEFQSIARAAIARNRVRVVLKQSFQYLPVLVEFQAVARGAALRTKLCNDVLSSLIGEDFHMNLLFAKIRANLCRAAIKRDLHTLAMSSDSFCAVQTLFRGLLARFQMDEKLDTFYDKIDAIIDLQAIIRGIRLRKDMNDIHEYYQVNISRVVKVQRILQKILAQTAYKSLVNMRSPPLSVVRKFSSHLLNSIGDLAEDLRLSKYKDRILELTRQNEDLELQIDSLDAKLAILNKKIISTDEFMAHKLKLAPFKPNYQSLKTSQEPNLSHSTKKRLEIYLSFFYLLQTNPLYFMRYFNSLRHDPDTLVSAVNLTVNLYSSKSTPEKGRTREEYFVLKLFLALVKSDYLACSNIADITKVKQALWIRLFLCVNNHKSHRKALVFNFGRLLRLLWDADKASFEADPCVIYAQIRDKEIRVHGSSDKIERISPSAAIVDKAVSEKFINNLMHLRDFAAEFVDRFSEKTSSFPLHVRLIAREIYQLSKVHFPESPEQMHLSVAGVVVVRHYVSGLLQNPSLYGFNSPATPLCKTNFVLLSRVLVQMFSMKPFKDNFMKPLNDFVLSYTDTIKKLIRELINVQSLDSEYGLNDFDDLMRNDKPTITMNMRDMVSIEALVSKNLAVFAPDADDQLRTLVTKLGEVFSDSNDYAKLAGLGNYTLTLAPISSVETIEESKKKMLMAQAKRYVLILIHVQHGDNLLEILIEGVTPVYEKKFQELKKHYELASDVPRIDPVDSFSELKQKLLQVLLHLENMGEISRKTSYQEILDLMVLDIKTKGSQREFRKNQAGLALKTIFRLEKKKEVLEKQLKDFNMHVNQILEALQLRPKERRFLNIPVFSKQYFYHRQLRKNNCFPKFGSYKHAAKKMMDQGVITFIRESVYRKSGLQKLDFKFSCHEVGVFTIEAACSAINIPGLCSVINLDDVLDRQQGKVKDWAFFKNRVVFDSDNLVALIFKHFYEVNIK